MIDIHSHFLPEIDDGPYDIEESLNILRRSVEDGVDEMVATPHSKMVWEKMPIHRLRELFKEYQRKVNEAGIAVHLHLGMENRLEPGLGQKFDIGDALTIGNSKYMLVELPFEEYPVYANDVLFDLQVRGLVPVLAHPERNAGIQRDLKIASKLAMNGVIMQVTSESFVGSFGTQAKRCAVSLLRGGMVHAIAADAHTSTGHRRPQMSSGRDAIRAIGGPALAAAVTDEIPRAIVYDRGLDLTQIPLTPKRKFWQILR